MLEVTGHANVTAADEALLRTTYAGHIFVPASARKFLEKSKESNLQFRHAIDRNTVKTFVTSDWEIVSFGNKIRDILREFVLIMTEMSAVFGTPVKIIGIDEVSSAGTWIFRKDALVNLGISLAVAFVSPALDHLTKSSTNSTIPVENLIFSYFLVAAIVFGAGLGMIYFIKK